MNSLATEQYFQWTALVMRTIPSTVCSDIESNFFFILAALGIRTIIKKLIAKGIYFFFEPIAHRYIYVAVYFALLS